MGVLAVLVGLARLGFVANFISEPVLKGFIIGLSSATRSPAWPARPNDVTRHG
jgi:hypothetical protein